MIDHTPSLKRIQEKLERLREADRKCATPGALSHRYQVGQPLMEDGLKRLEARLGVTIPSGYRRFVSEVGHGGAGPYGGLYKLDDEDSESITAYENLGKPFRWTEAFNPEDWEDPCEEEGVECDDDGKVIGMIPPGAHYLSEYGCSLRFFLIVTGPCRGEVWHDWQANGDGIYPAVDASGRRLGFLEWYEEWLDRSLSALAEKGL